MNPLLALVQPITEIVNKLIPDKAKAAEIQFEIFKLTTSAESQMSLAQLEINKTEAASGPFGQWRAALGWVLVTAVAVNFLVVPGADYAAKFYDFPPVPRLDMGEIWPLLLGLLGLGGLKSYEKVKGVA